ncbi:MAG: hypothetical protein AAF503_08515 [Pseudomonadota bacterium]
MRIGLLHVGRMPEELADRHGVYPPVFPDLLLPAGPEIVFDDHFVLEGALPGAVDTCDAWLVTGSAAGVYDSDPWIAPIRDFLVRCRAGGRPVVGICFGHQLMAEALGGRAELSHRGWGCGVHRYDVLHRPAWMADAPEALSLHAMHRDQVVAIPGDATVLAASAFCPYAMLAYGDPEAPDAISIQPHPEFVRGVAEDLTALRTGDGKIPAEVGAPALATYGDPVHNAQVARWIVAYLRAVVSARADAA